MIQIRSTAELGKSLSVKREKDGDDVIVACHLKFADLFCDREQFDEICRQPIGWHGAFFDELGAPVNVFDIGLPLSSWSVTGRIKGGDSRPEELRLLQATLSGVTCTLTKLGALLSGSLSWKARGDEAEDLTELLGRLVAVDWQIADGGQQDLLAPRASGFPPSSEAEKQEVADAKEMQSIGHVTSRKRVEELMTDGWLLSVTEGYPGGTMISADGTLTASPWVNATRALLNNGWLDEVSRDGDTIVYKLKDSAKGKARGEP